MKRFITLLLLSVSLFQLKTSAQTSTVCNAAFDFAFLNSNTVKFTPATVTDSPFVQHSWFFGDGSVSSNSISPSHTYLTSGTFSIRHYLVRYNPNGVLVCVDTLTKLVTIQQLCTTVANFSFTPLTANPLSISFLNLSSSLSSTDSIRWTFGDGTTSLDLNPTHAFPAAGTYTVCLRVKKNNNAAGTTPCVSEVCKTVIIAQTCNIVANFSWTSFGNNPLAIALQNLSVTLSPTDSIRWTFGDGSTSIDVNPTHAYAAAGTYTVCLRVKKNLLNSTTPCVSEICKTIVVQQSCNLVSYFTWSAVANNALDVAFLNLSAPLAATDSIRWTFGDGSTSTDINPTHHYANAGTYTVCLRVKKAVSATSTASCTSEICKTVVVVVNQTCSLVTNFSWSNTAANPMNFAFQNLSTPLATTDSVQWSFGDGTFSNSVNATHAYTNAGTYRVCLRVKKNVSVSSTATCIREICKTIVVQPAISCNLQAYFTWTNSTANTQNVIFQNLSTPLATGDSVRWTFGDGTSSTAVNPAHNYANAGTYTVCLRVRKMSNTAGTTACVREICKIITILPRINCDSIVASYTFQRDPLIPNKLYFLANSNSPIQDQTWTISKIPSSSSQPTVTLHQNNPAYSFTDTGYYRVCLKVVTIGGCVREYCSNIHIEQVTPICDLQVYPNPANSQINAAVLLLQANVIHAFIYNAQNNLVRERTQQGVVGNNLISISIADLVPGTYTIKIIYGNRLCIGRFNKI